MLALPRTRFLDSVEELRHFLVYTVYLKGFDTMKHPFPRRWLNLGTREIDAEIVKRRLPFHLAEALRNLVLAEKRAIKSERAKRRTRVLRWQPLLRGVKYEMHKVDLRIQYFEKAGIISGPRVDAQRFYAQVLGVAYQKMEALRTKPGEPLPKSADWRDFIPPGVKTQVILRFDAIPRGERKRVAEPFSPPRKLTDTPSVSSTGRPRGRPSHAAAAAQLKGEKQ